MTTDDALLIDLRRHLRPHQVRSSLSLRFLHPFLLLCALRWRGHCFLWPSASLASTPCGYAFANVHLGACVSFCNSSVRTPPNTIVASLCTAPNSAAATVYTGIQRMMAAWGGVSDLARADAGDHGRASVDRPTVTPGTLERVWIPQSQLGVSGFHASEETSLLCFSSVSSEQTSLLCFSTDTYEEKGCAQEIKIRRRIAAPQ